MRLLQTLSTKERVQQGPRTVRWREVSTDSDGEHEVAVDRIPGRSGCVSLDGFGLLYQVPCPQRVWRSTEYSQYSHPPNPPASDSEDVVRVGQYWFQPTPVLKTVSKSRV